MNVKSRVANDKVTRGELKLLGAIEEWGFDFRDKVVLDIGSSTGGFTEVALDKGAAKVIAVEKGTRQMKAPLRYDPRVELHEKTDIFDVNGLKVDVVLADVSFISLRPVLIKARELAKSDANYLMMLKPQFEAKPEQSVRGVVKNEKMRREIIKAFEGWLRQYDFVILKKRDNQLAGKNGNKERFYWLKSVNKA